MMGETNFNEMSETSILKKLTGGDLIGFEYKNKNCLKKRTMLRFWLLLIIYQQLQIKPLGFIEDGWL